MGIKKKIQNTYREKFVFRFDARYGKVVWKIDATHLLHDTSIDYFVTEVFLQWQCIMTWKNEEARVPYYKTMFVEWGNHAHQYMSEPSCHPSKPLTLTHFNESNQYTLSPNKFRKGTNDNINTCENPSTLSPIWTIDFMQFNSHSLWCETRCWGTSDEKSRLCTPFN